MTTEVTPAALEDSLQQIALRCSPETERAIRGHIAALESELTAAKQKAELLEHADRLHSKQLLEFSGEINRRGEQLAALQLQVKVLRDALKTHAGKHYLCSVCDRLLEQPADTSQFDACVAEKFKEQEQWVSVDEGLPELKSQVLVYSPTYGMFPAIYRIDGWYNAYAGSYYGHVTHWRPMPNAPTQPADARRGSERQGVEETRK